MGLKTGGKSGASFIRNELKSIKSKQDKCRGREDSQQLLTHFFWPVFTVRTPAAPLTSCPMTSLLYGSKPNSSFRLLI